MRIDEVIAKAFGPNSPADLSVASGGTALAFATDNFQRLRLSLPDGPIDAAAFLAEADRSVWTMPDRFRRRLAALALALDGQRPNAYFLASPQCPPLLLAGLARLMAQRLAFSARLLVVAVKDHDVARLESDLEGAFPVVTLAQAAGDDRPAVLMLPTGPSNGQPPLDSGAHDDLLAIVLKRPVILNVHSLGIVTVLKPFIEGNSVEMRPDNADPVFHPHRGANSFMRALVRNTQMQGGLHGFRVRNACNAIGPIDAFGFRIGGDLAQLEGRDRSHMVVAMFGGSATHGDKCFHDDTIPARLEVVLEEAIGRAGLALSVSVLNFGISTWMASDELHAYLFHCLGLAPDIVIAHSGFNDLFMGMNADATLLKGRSLPYHLGEFDGMWGADETIKGRFNEPGPILKAIERRAQQFRRVVEADGGRFVYGIQPASFGRALAPAEARAVAAYNRDMVLVDAANAQRLKRLELLYPMFRDKMLAAADDTGLTVVDCHQHIAKTSPDEDLFFDIAHMTPSGNHAAALLYAETLMPLFHLRARELAA